MNSLSLKNASVLTDYTVKKFKGMKSALETYKIAIVDYKFDI